MAEDAASAFAFGITTDGDSTTVAFSGELDFSTVENMRQVFLQSDLAAAAEVSVDLTHATFMDSAAVGILVVACKQVRTDGGNFSVSCDRGPVQLVLEIAGLLEYLQVRLD